MQLGVILLLQCFKKKSTFWFSPNSRGYLVLGSWFPKQFEEFHLVEWALSQISYCLATLTALWHNHYNIPCRQNTVAHPKVCGWIGFYSSLQFFGSTQRTLLCKDAHSQGWRLYEGTGLTSSCSVNCVGAVYSSRALLSGCGEQMYSLGLGCLGIPMRPLQPTIQLYVM